MRNSRRFKFDLRRSAIAVAVCVAASSVQAVEPVKIDLWPGGAPVENGFDPKNERIENGYKLMDVANAELWIYPAKNPNGMAVMLTPGGGYQCLVIYKEGTMFAEWLSSQGITCGVLKYRMPNGHREIPLMDAQRGMEIMRAKAAEFHYNKDEIGVMGGSAGGHFAAMLSTMYDSPATRPDFQILLYPVISMDGSTIGHKPSAKRLLGDDYTAEDVEKYSLQNRVTPMTPPAFILLASDDKIVDPMNSYEYAEALLRNKVPYTLHVFPDGGHGFGMLDTNPNKREMQEEIMRWLKSIHNK